MADFCDVPPVPGPPRLPRQPPPPVTTPPTVPDPGPETVGEFITPGPAPTPTLPGMPYFVPQTPALQPYVAPTGAPEFFQPNPQRPGAPGPSSQGVQFPYDDRGSDSPYTEYACTVEYELDTGMLQCPAAAGPTTAAPKPSAVMVRVHAPAARKVVKYFAERAGSQPLLPPPPADDATQTLLSAVVHTEQPFLEGGAHTWQYRVAATYVYALVQPQTPDQGYSVGAPAYSTLLPSDTFLRPQNFVSGILPQGA